MTPEEDWLGAMWPSVASQLPDAVVACTSLHHVGDQDEPQQPQRHSWPIVRRGAPSVRGCVVSAVIAGPCSHDPRRGEKGQASGKGQAAGRPGSKLGTSSR